MHRRRGEADRDVEWARDESRRRGLPLVEWWIGWAASPPPGIADELPGRGLVPDDDEPVLTGMTCDGAAGVPRRRGAARRDPREQYLEALEVDWEVWHIPDAGARGPARDRGERFDHEMDPGRRPSLSARLDDGRPVGFGRGIDMDAESR